MTRVGKIMMTILQTQRRYISLFLCLIGSSLQATTLPDFNPEIQQTVTSGAIIYSQPLGGGRLECTKYTIGTKVNNINCTFTAGGQVTQPFAGQAQKTLFDHLAEEYRLQIAKKLTPPTSDNAPRKPSALPIQQTGSQ